MSYFFLFLVFFFLSLLTLLLSKEQLCSHKNNETLSASFSVVKVCLFRKEKNFVLASRKTFAFVCSHWMEFGFAQEFWFWRFFLSNFNFFFHRLLKVCFCKRSAVFSKLKNKISCFKHYESIHEILYHFDLIFWRAKTLGEKYCHFHEISWASTRCIREIVVFSWSRFLIYILNLIVLSIIFSLKKKTIFCGHFWDLTN